MNCQRRMGRCVAAIVSWSIGLSAALLGDFSAAAAQDPSFRSIGCGVTAARTGLIDSTVVVAGRPRTYLLQVPSHYDSSRPYPLVFVFHGAGSNAQQSYSWGLQKAAGAADAAIFVFPNAIAFEHYGIGWDDGAYGHDLPFFDAMLKDLETVRCIDPSRVYVAGFSWGGDFAIALACHRGAVIRAVAANSTNDEYSNLADYRTYNGLPCGSTQHPPVRFGHAVGGDKEYPPPDFATTSKLFQYLNGCPGGSTPVASSTPVMSCRSYAGCAAEYTECEFDAHIGHTLPPNWAEDTWKYFSK